MIQRRGASARKALLLFGLGLQILFSVRAALPQTVLCHRAGGGAAVEFDADSGCLCEECEHCRARLAAPHGAPAGPSWEPCHCRHEAFSAEGAGTALRLPGRSAVIESSPAPAEEIFDPPTGLRFSFLARGPFGQPPGPPGSSGPLLRC